VVGCFTLKLRANTHARTHSPEGSFVFPNALHASLQEYLQQQNNTSKISTSPIVIHHKSTHLPEYSQDSVKVLFTDKISFK